MVVSTDLENKCLALLIWHRVEIRDEVRVLTCSLKVRFESNIIPRSLTEDTGIKCCPRKGTLISGTPLKSCFVPKRISLVLSGLISNLFVQHQEAISRRSSETFARQESILFDEHERETFVSSTYDSTLENLTIDLFLEYTAQSL